MIYSARHNYLFIHIPKTGGTSMALALEARAAKDDIMLGDTPKALRRRKRVAGVQSSGRLWKHARLRDLYGLLTPEQIEAARVFTMVRNPWARMVSYYHWLQTQSFEHEAVALAKELGFSAFLNHPHTRASFRANAYASYVVDPDGAETCALYLRLEHLEEDVPRLEALIGLKLQPFPHANASESGEATDYRRFYSEADCNRLGEICADDIKRFDYRFE